MISSTNKFPKRPVLAPLTAPLVRSTPLDPIFLEKFQLKQFEKKIDALRDQAAKKVTDYKEPPPPISSEKNPAKNMEQCLREKQRIDGNLSNIKKDLSDLQNQIDNIKTESKNYHPLSNNIKEKIKNIEGSIELLREKQRLAKQNAQEHEKELHDAKVVKQELDKKQSFENALYEAAQKEKKDIQEKLEHIQKIQRKFLSLSDIKTISSKEPNDIIFTIDSHLPEMHEIISTLEQFSQKIDASIEKVKNNMQQISKHSNAYVQIQLIKDDLEKQKQELNQFIQEQRDTIQQASRTTQIIAEALEKRSSMEEELNFILLDIQTKHHAFKQKRDALLHTIKESHLCEMPIQEDRKHDAAIIEKKVTQFKKEFIELRQLKKSLNSLKKETENKLKSFNVYNPEAKEFYASLDPIKKQISLEMDQIDKNIDTNHDASLQQLSQFARQLSIIDNQLKVMSQIEEICKKSILEIEIADNLLNFIKTKITSTQIYRTIKGEYTLLTNLKKDYATAEMNLNHVVSQLTIARNMADVARLASNQSIENLEAELNKTTNQLKQRKIELDSFQKILQNDEKKKNFAEVLIDKGINEHIDYLSSLQRRLKNDYHSPILLKGGFSALFGVYLYHSDPDAFSQIQVNDIDATIYLNNDESLKKLCSYLLEKNGFIQPHEQQHSSYINLQKIINGKWMQLTLVTPEYKGNQLIAPLVSGQVAILHSHLGKKYIKVKRGVGMALNLSLTNDYFKAACEGEELYVPYNHTIHKKYCVVFLKAHLKSKEIVLGESLEHDGLCNYENALKHLEKEFSRLFTIYDRSPHMEIFKLLKEFKSIDQNTKPLLEVYFKSLTIFHNQQNTEKSILLSQQISGSNDTILKIIVDDIISYIEKNDFIINNPRLNDSTIQLMFTKIVEYVLDLRFKDLLNPMSEKIKQSLSETLKKIAAPRNEAQHALSPLRNFSLHPHSPMTRSPTSTSSTDSPSSSLSISISSDRLSDSSLSPVGVI